MEIELKLAIAATQIAKLKRHPVLVGCEVKTRRLHSTYLDTPDWALMRRGVALRLRRLEGEQREWVQTMKAEAAAVGALSSRPEWEVKLPRGRHDINLLPAEAQALLNGVDVAAIRPAFVTAFKRMTWQVRFEGAEMEVALDVGKVSGQVGEKGSANTSANTSVKTSVKTSAKTEASDPSDRQSEMISELEIELKSGSPNALFALAKSLMESVEFGLEPRSKAMRGYALAGAIKMSPVRARTPELNPEQHAGEIWRTLMADALAQTVNNLPGMLSYPASSKNLANPEYLHQLRIGLRRLRALTDLLPCRVSAKGGSTKPAWRAALKSLMHHLDAARDWDVLCDELLPAIEASFTDSPLSTAFKRSLAQHRQHADAEAAAAVKSQAFVRCVLEIGEHLAMPLDRIECWENRGEESRTNEAKYWAAAQLQQRWQAVLKRGKGFRKLDSHQRHALRIEAKRLRYAAEMLAPLFSRPRRIKSFLAKLSALQTQLGALQDGVVAMRLMGALVSRSKSVLFDAGRLSGAIASRVSHAAPQDQQVWRALVRSNPFWV